MPDSFFFYDLETSGVSPARDRIMQFAGQRTDMDLKPIGDPININVALSRDILPSPRAIIVSDLSPLKNVQTGMTEAQFTKIFNDQIALPKTIFTGFNNVRFDDEFIRYTNYRNFYDAYSWHWQNNSSRWDLLDVVRMTRALRPEGINWPFNEQGKPFNRLEYLTKINNLKHQNAHDALSDALATIEVAKLISLKQPNLFNFLLSLRTKKELIKILNNNQILIYTSSHYSSTILHTTIVFVLSSDPLNGTALVYDLREDVHQFLDLSVDQLADLWRYDPNSPKARLPIKTIKLNRCPAIAPRNVLDEASKDRLQIDMNSISKNIKQISKYKDDLALKIHEVIKLLDNEQEERRKKAKRMIYADEKLYDKFIDKKDANLFIEARQKANFKKDYLITFSDQRLNKLYRLYRCRNYPNKLTNEEKSFWHEFIKDKLFNNLNSYYSLFAKELEEVKKEYQDNNQKMSLLKDLASYAQAIVKEYS